jgi:hypothetical protein
LAFCENVLAELASLMIAADKAIVDYTVAYGGNLSGLTLVDFC